MHHPVCIWRHETRSLKLIHLYYINEEYIGHILCRNCLLKHVTEGEIQGRIEATGRRGRRRKQLLVDLEERILKIERGSTRSHSAENSLWTSLWTCRKTNRRISRTYALYLLCADGTESHRLPLCHAAGFKCAVMFTADQDTYCLLR